MSEPIYAVGDIHGHLAQLDRVLALIEADGGSGAGVVFLGDFVDRGPDSAGVLDRIIAGRAAGRRWTPLLGNHDRMFRLFLQSPPQLDPYLLVGLHWLHPRIGGDTTLASYGMEVDARMRLKTLHAQALDRVPPAHVDFLAGLGLSHRHGDLFFVHAGIRPEVPLDRQSEEDLIWIRDEFHEFAAPHPCVIVHGHTPVDRATDYGNRINLDTGAGYGHPLTVAVFEDGEVWQLTEAGRQRLACP
jgi:serine/threonine protein phosphatase 1